MTLLSIFIQRERDSEFAFGLVGQRGLARHFLLVHHNTEHALPEPLLR